MSRDTETALSNHREEMLKQSLDKFMENVFGQEQKGDLWVDLGY